MARSQSKDGNESAGERPALTEPTTYSRIAVRTPPASPAHDAAKTDGDPQVVVTRVIEVNGAPKSRPRIPAVAGEVRTPVMAPRPPPLPARTPEAPTLTLDPLPPRVPAPAAPPPAPAPAPAPEKTPSVADAFERLLGEVDAGFDDLEVTTERMAKSLRDPKLASVDLAEVRELFAQLAANHMRQVRDFMIDVRWGEATVDWIAVCEPAVRSLRRAAEKLEFKELEGALDAFAAALAEARAKCAGVLEGEAKDALALRYDELSAIMPQAFALDMDRTQREAVILQSLLLQVPEVKKLTLDKLYAAGLTTLSAMFLAREGDLVAACGIAPEVARAIVERFSAYHAQARAQVPDATRAREREKIAELREKLRAEHEELEQVSEAWSKTATQRKKELRALRARTLLDVHVLLARLGEVDVLRELERLPFDGKIEHLAKFLEKARVTYAAAM